MKSWLAAFEKQMRACFGNRVRFLGLQGSRARGEAHEGSDIDVVVVLDEVSLCDLRSTVPCWTSCRTAPWCAALWPGEQELRCWDAAELLQFYFDTVPVYGTLDFLRPALTPHSARRAVLSGACGIYHACAHNYVHAPQHRGPAGGCARRRCSCCARSTIVKPAHSCAQGAS